MSHLLIKASFILEIYYPENKIDQVYVNNLIGLLDYYSGYFKKAENKFSASAKILSDNHISKENFSYAYLNTYLWELKNIDSLCTGNELFIKKQQELSRWQELASDWQNWEEANQLPELHYYRDIYSVDPFSIIVLLCYDLYQYKKNNSYIDIALEAQENSKCYFLKKKMIKNYILPLPPVPTIQTIRQNLSPNQAVISFSDVMSYINCSYAVVITFDTVALVKFDILQLFKGEGNIKKSDSVCKDITSFKSLNYLAYNVFFKPVQQLFRKKVDHLLILPSTFSSYINFEMMVSDTLGFRSFANLPYLANQYHFNFEFSWQVAALRKQIANNRQNNSNNIQAYVPDYSNTRFYQLPFFTKSAGILKTKFGFTVFSNKRAGLSVYEANAGKARILHIAGHCYSNDRSAEDLHIAMDSLKADHLNYLDAENIIRIPLSADLTVLSLCETGIGEAFVNGSYLNMAYWFSYAGSKSCLYSYWKLDDRSTAYILERFYHYLAKGMKKSEALREAKKNYLVQTKTDEEKNPIYWGGLVLIGDDSPVSITESKKISYWYLCLLLAIPAIVYLYKRKRMNKLYYQSLLFASTCATFSL
ncbi:MAG: CHAT domain-containing protein [Chitinophagaceae bacterium]|nr:CHAT domain-containing protein [Chitinophagaceae bacterium]